MRKSNRSRKIKSKKLQKYRNSRKNKKSRKTRKPQKKRIYRRKTKSISKKINKKGKGNSNSNSNKKFAFSKNNNNIFEFGYQSFFEEQPCFNLDQGGRGFCWMTSSMILLLSASYRGLIKLHPDVENFLKDFKTKFDLGTFNDGSCPIIKPKRLNEHLLKNNISFEKYHIKFLKSSSIKPEEQYIEKEKLHAYKIYIDEEDHHKLNEKYIFSFFQEEKIKEIQDGFLYIMDPNDFTTEIEEIFHIKQLQELSNQNKYIKYDNSYYKILIEKIKVEEDGNWPQKLINGLLSYENFYKTVDLNFFDDYSDIFNYDNIKIHFFKKKYNKTKNLPNFPNKIIFLKKFLFKDPNANLNKLEEVEKSILKYKNKILGGLLIVSFNNNKSHAIAFTFCQNKIKYCNTWVLLVALMKIYIRN